MKRILLFVSFLGIMPFLFAQERMNKPLPVVSENVLSQLDSATGWYYMKESGQWYESKNNVYGSNQFEKYEFRTISCGQKEYLLFAKYSTHGYYKYPELKIGLTSYTGIDYCILDIENYKEVFQTIKSTQRTLIRLKILKRGGSVRDRDDKFEHLETRCASLCNPTLEEKSDYDYFLNIQLNLFEGKDIAQFLFFESSVSKKGKTYIDHANQELGITTY